MPGKKKDIDQTLQEITTSLLYEGYALYPYRTTALKNKTPIPFGVIYPEKYGAQNKYSDSRMRTESLLIGNDETELIVTIKFLQVHNSNNEWQAEERQVISRQVNIRDLLCNNIDLFFKFSGQNDSLEIEGHATIHLKKMNGWKDTFLLSVSIANTTPVPDNVSGHKILEYAFVSTHTILECRNGEFISEQNPREEFRELVKGCHNLRTYPVLIDEENTTMLSSPIILYDHPKINNESKGELFDGTEMEEALWLHINALTESEKEQLSTVDEKIQSLLDTAKQITPTELIHLHDYLKPTGDENKRE